MSHSVIGADRGTHTKIVAVALAGAILVALVGIAAREASPPGAISRVDPPLVVRAGKAANFAALERPNVR